MVITFSKNRKTTRFVVYKSDDVEDVGDFSKIYIRNGCDLAQDRELVLISLEEYQFLRENIKETVRDYE